MPQTPYPSPAPVATAVDAFLKGVERRAWVLAHAQCGDPRAAEVTLATSLMRFRHGAADLPMADWPARFWTLLLARPELRAPASASEHAELRGLSAGPRAILLLRLVAGLDEEAIAGVLGVSRAAVRLSLARAIQSLPPPGADSLATLRERLLEAVRGLPADRVQRLAALRRASLGRQSDGLPAAGTPRRGLLVPVLWVALAAVVAAFAGSFFLPPADPALAPGEQRELPLALPTVLPPESAALASPDFEDALEPAQAVLADDLLFYSWLAAQLSEDPDAP